MKRSLYRIAPLALAGLGLAEPALAQGSSDTAFVSAL